MGTLLIFTDEKLLAETKSIDEIHKVADALKAKGEVFFIYSNNSGSWYVNYDNCLEEDVPAVYRTLKLMLTN